MRELEREIARLEALYRLTSTVSQATDLDVILQEALRCLHATLGADRSSILLMDDEGVMRFRAWRGLSETYRRAVDGHSPWTADERDPQPILVSDVAEAAAMAPYREAFAAENIESLAFVPLVARERLLGKFMVYFAEPHHYGQRDVELALNIAQHVGLAVDRQEMDQRHAELYEAEQRARREAERAVEDRDHLLAVVSHDLRTPLTAIAVAVSLLETSDGPRGHLDTIQRATSSMDRLIADLLDFERLRAGALQIRRHPHRCGEILTDVVTLMQPLARHKDLSLRAVSGELDTMVSCDRDRTTQVLSNLISNAIRFAPDGTAIELAAKAGEGWVEISVSDRGPGIPPDAIDRVFERHYQAAPNGHGVGLGLSIARALVEAHGGEIRIESDRDTGTTVSFTLPLA